MLNFQYIQTQENLDQAIEELKCITELAVDLECENNLHHYGTYISLIQLSNHQNNWVVDVLKSIDIKPLLKILEDKKIQKVFHDVSFDFRILNHQFKCQPKNVFDTQTAALLIGKEKIGLGSLLEEMFNIKKEKKFQKIDWTKRPLSLAQLNYAVKDTAYLLKLKNWLVENLSEKNRLHWMHEEIDYLDTIDFSLKEQTYLDLSGAKSMQADERARLHVLFEERKNLAKKVDKPVFMVFSNKQLLAFAKNPPYNVQSWRKLKSVHPIVHKQADYFDKLIKNAGEEEYVRKKKQRLSIDLYEKIKQLTEERNKLGEKLKIAAHLLLNNDQIREIVVNQNLSNLRDWQRDLISKEGFVSNTL